MVLDFQSDFAELGVIRAYGPGSELLQQGTRADEVYLIHEGLVKLVWTESRGKQTILGVRSRGHALGLASAITGEGCPMSAVTLLRSRLQRVQAQDFLKLLQTNADLAWKVHQINSWELCEQVNSFGELACCTARSRLAKVFRRLIAAGHAETVGKNTRVRLPLKQREVAELVGVTPEHLNRMLHELSNDGLLQLSKGWIVISNLQGIEV